MSDIFFYECENCHTVFLFGEDCTSKNLICGGGCGGSIAPISEERANRIVDELRDKNG